MTNCTGRKGLIDTMWLPWPIGMHYCAFSKVWLGLTVIIGSLYVWSLLMQMFMRGL